MDCFGGGGKLWVEGRLVIFSYWLDIDIFNNILKYLCGISLIVVNRSLKNKFVYFFC